jgi:hypothetical protein
MLGLLLHNHYSDKTELHKFSSLGDLERWADSMAIPRERYLDHSGSLMIMLDKLAAYLSRHHLDAQVIDEDKIAQLEGNQQELEEELQKAEALVEILEKFDADVSLYDQYRPQLEAIADIESSGHQFRKHPMVQAGIHKGTHAQSSYGLMPLSLHFLAENNKRFADTPTGKEILKLAGKNPKANWHKIAALTNNQEHDNVAAAHLWNYQRDRVSKFANKKHDLDVLTAYAHRHGIRGTYDKIKESGGYKQILSNGYVVKFLGFLPKRKEAHKLRVSSPLDDIKITPGVDGTNVDIKPGT